MDARKARWFIYVRYEKTWQIDTPSLSTVTIYYNQIPLEIQRGWLVNYFGTKVIVSQGETKVGGIWKMFVGYSEKKKNRYSAFSHCSCFC